MTASWGPASGRDGISGRHGRRDRGRDGGGMTAAVRPTQAELQRPGKFFAATPSTCPASACLRPRRTR